MKTTYNGMKVFANFDKTQCGLDIGISEGYLITTQMEKDWDSPILLQGHVEHLQDAKDERLLALYNEIKSERYFIILKSDR